MGGLDPSLPEEQRLMGVQDRDFTSWLPAPSNCSVIA